ncbi:MAG: DegV family protein [Clostridia bacterium]|nr:DegV family protein [Clostridia bacterium]
MLRIVVDSTADMPEELQSQFTVVPLSVSFGDELYIDGVTINHKMFYEKLTASSKLPTTSQPSPDAYARVFEEAKQAGDTLLVLCVSSGISGTYQSAMIAAQDYPDTVTVVDTLHVANGFGILAEYALQLLKAGKDAQEIADAILEERNHIEFYALLDTLDYLHKGGRISKTAAFAGTLLSLKPIVCMKDGKLGMLGKARGMKQGRQLLIKEILSAGVDLDKPYLMGYTGLSDELLRSFLQDSESVWSEGSHGVRSVPLCPVVGTHAGPGAVVVAFFKKH